MMRADIPAAEADFAEQSIQPEAQMQRLAFLFRRAGADVTMQALLRAMAEYAQEKRSCSR